MNKLKTIIEEIVEEKVSAQLQLEQADDLLRLHLYELWGSGPEVNGKIDAAFARLEAAIDDPHCEFVQVIKEVLGNG